MPKMGKDRAGRGIVFDALSYFDFDNVPSIGASVANTSIQGRLVLPLRTKVVKVAVNYSGIGTGTHSFNIVLGSGAIGQPILTADAQAVTGTPLFATDQVLTNAADVPQVFTVSNPDLMLDTAISALSSTALLTLRVTTPGSTGSLTNLKVSLLMLAEDAYRQRGGGVPGVDY